MSIIRAARKNQFYVLPTTTIEDNRLSWEARGMLVYLLSKPDHWEVRVEDLLARTRNCLGKRSGRDKVYSILKELQMAGYVVRQYDRQGGAFQGMTYEVAETPDLDAGAARKRVSLNRLRKSRKRWHRVRIHRIRLSRIRQTRML